MRLRGRIVGTVAAVAVLLPCAEAGAITSGEPDGQGHPYVGMLQALDANYVPLWVCTGSALSPTVLLTAAHCVEPPAAHVEVWFAPGPIQPDIDYLLALFLQPGFSGSCHESPLFDGYPCIGDASGTPYPHPDFCFGCGNGTPHEVVRDVGVVALDRPPAEGRISRYAHLAAPGAADALPSGTPIDFTGYGVRDQAKLPGKYSSKPPPYSRWGGSGERLLTTGQLLSGAFANADEFLRLSVNGEPGAGGICFGDSGGPDLLEGTDTVLAVNSSVSNPNCAGVAYGQRVDVPAVHVWISGFMSQR